MYILKKFQDNQRLLLYDISFEFDSVTEQVWYKFDEGNKRKMFDYLDLENFEAIVVPTVGPAHGGFEFWKGSFEGIKGYTMGRMTKSRRGKLYIHDAGWGPEPGSIEYGYRVPFGGIHVFIARSASLALSRTSAPASLKWLSMRNPPLLRLP